MDKQQELERDAARYRYIRNNMTGEGPSIWLGTGYGEGYPHLGKEEADAAIDAAIAAQQAA